MAQARGGGRASKYELFLPRTLYNIFSRLTYYYFPPPILVLISCLPSEFHSLAALLLERRRYFCVSRLCWLHVCSLHKCRRKKEWRTGRVQRFHCISLYCQVGKAGLEFVIPPESLGSLPVPTFSHSHVVSAYWY
jgi:hypothetical protein